MGEHLYFPFVILFCLCFIYNRLFAVPFLCCPSTMLIFLSVTDVEADMYQIL